MSIFLLLMIVGITAFFVTLFDKPRSTKVNQAMQEVQVYRKQSKVMNRSESAFFFELQKQLPAGYYVFPKMRVADIIQPIDGKGFYRRRNKILPRHIDFLICDTNFAPVLAIELNGSSHHRADRIESDQLKRDVFANAKVPLEFVNVGTSFEQSIGHIKSQLPTANIS